MATLKIDGPDGKTYSVDVPEGAAPEAVAEQFAAEMWPNAKTDTGLTAIKNTADIAGAGVGAALAGTGELARSVMKEPPKLGQRLYEEFWGGKKNVPKSAKEAISRFIPVDPAERAKKLGVPLTPNREALARGAEYLTGAASLGAPAKMAGLAGIGGAAGQRAAGDEGAVAMGLALPLVGLRASASNAAPALTRAEITPLRKAAFDRAEQAGAVVSQGSLARFVNDLHPPLAARSFARDTHPTAFKAYQELADQVMRGNVTMDRLFKMHGRLGALKSSAPTAQDAAAVGLIRDEMRNYVSGMQLGRDVIAGDMRAVQAFREGNQLYRREMGLKTIEKLIERAKTNAHTYTAAGFDTALRNQFKALVNNEKQMRFFTAPERAALTKIARGGPIANTMRQLSRLAPQNILYTLLGAQLHPAMLGASAMGAGAKVAASGLTKRNIKLAQDLIARGYPVPPNLRRYLDAAPAAGGVFVGQGSRTTQ